MKRHWVLVRRTVAEARVALSERYDEQRLRFPLLRDTATKEQYIAVNLNAARTYYKEVVRP